MNKLPVKKESQIVSLVKSGKSLDQALDKKTETNFIFFSLGCLVLSAVLCLLHSFEALGLTIPHSLFSNFLSGFLAVSNGLGFLWFMIVNKKQEMKKLTQEEKDLCKQIESQREKVDNLIKEYNQNHQGFITKVFGAYSTELSMMVGHEIKMNPSCILELVDETHSKHQELKKRVSSLRLQ